MATHVSVQTLTGDEIQLDAEPQTKVETLKFNISKIWLVPPECQELVLGGQVLDSSDDLVAHCSPNETLALTMLISLKEQMESLAGTSVAKRRAALQVIGRFGPKWHAGVVATLRQHLENHTDIDVLELSVFWIELGADDTKNKELDVLEALASLVQRGDEQIIASAKQYLKHHNPKVRSRMTAVLSKAATRDDEHAIAAICLCLTDTAIVRVATVNALQDLKGNAHALSIVRLHLEHEDYPVRCSAIQALRNLSEKGDEGIMVTLRKLLMDRNPNVRNAAEHALHHLAAPNHQTQIAGG